MKMVRTNSKSMIVFAPHPDDETLGCGGTIVKRINDGFSVYIVFMTDGRNSHRYLLGIQKDPTSVQLKSLRREEAIKATEILGIPRDRLIFLDFEDGYLEFNLSKAKKKVREIMDRIKPIEVFIPYEKEKHKDHRITNILVSLCIGELGLNTVVYEYIVNFDGKLNASNLLTVDISDTVKTKEKAIRVYRSQIELLFPHQDKPILSSDFLQNFSKPKEVFVSKKDFSYSKILVRSYLLRARAYLKRIKRWVKCI